ncbi:uncharacterized protein LOC118273561 [Spodoptera frugiperda]|uniref:Uncharacterized protein LOC118273561 n=2 Tax=Spodoptera frugiperda TaxID=7108 RepID=A0A9R0DAU5_SPOFR|nr:uncharacterized protein LOC118273561 [Spodoptera frugiperda]
MRMKVPEVKRCCCCVPLRHGIILFGLINIIFSMLAVTSLVITTELKKSQLIDGSSLEVVTSTILFSIFGMSVILNIMLLFAGCQKDVLMLRLYLYYGVVTTLAALVPTFILVSRMMTFDVCLALFAICMQWYVIILVRSEIVKLEQASLRAEERSLAHEVTIDVPDRDTLL